jgi:hypothetical protein
MVKTVITSHPMALDHPALASMDQAKMARKDWALHSLEAPLVVSWLTKWEEECSAV